MRSRWLLVLCLSIASLGSSRALAAPPNHADDDRQAAARAKGEEGLRLFEAGKWASAYDAFQRADEIFHAPTLVLYMAHCRRSQGKLIEARALYEKVASETVPKGAPDQFAKAVASAREELDRIRKRIASVRVTFSPPAPASTTLKIDGVAVSAEQGASGAELDPGDHEIVAEADKASAIHRTISLKEGEAAEIPLSFAKADDRGPSTPRRRGSIVPGAIALGVGGAFVGVGAVTGIMAFTKIADIKSRCRPDGHCLKADQPEASTARTLTTVSTVGFVVGGVALAAGAVLLVVRPGGAKANDKAALRVQVGPRSVSLEGRF